MFKSLCSKTFLILLVFMVVITGCTQPVSPPPHEEDFEEQEMEEDVPVEREEAPADSQEEHDGEALPESIETTLLIEGMEETTTLLLYQHEKMPFHTYYPEDMLFEEWIYDNEKGVRFFANFGGTINKNAYVEIKVFSQSGIVSESDFVAEITGESGVLENRGVEWVEKETDMDRIFPWSFIEYYYLNDEFVGSLYLGQHQDDYFYIDVHYPWEYGDGMESRAHLIMKEFLWTEGQRGLLE